MSRSLIPPRGIFTPSRLLFDKALPASARDTGGQLRALAWGKDETPPLSFAQLETLTGKKQSTIYEHMRLLRARGVLRWRPCGGATFIVSFDPEFWNSGILEMPVKGSLTESPEPKKDQEHADSKIPEIHKTPPHTAMRAIQDAYVELLGRPVDNWGAGEAQAAKRIAEHFTVEQFREAYQHYKAQPFWGDKHLTLRYLKDQIPEYFRSRGQKRNGHQTTRHPGASHPATAAVGQLERDRQLRVEREARRNKSG